MMSRPRPPIAIHPNGGYSIDLPEEEREVLALLPGQMLAALEILTQPEAIVPESLRRLFPPAYLTDTNADNAYVRLVRRDLLDYHREALLILRDSSDATQLDEIGMERWLTAISGLRLMLGSILGITDETKEFASDDANYYEWICYNYLSYLQGEIIEVLSEQLPQSIPDDQVELPADPWGEPPGGLRWDGTPLPGDR